MKSSQQEDQEVWITIKLKGYADVNTNLDETASKLLQAVQSTIGDKDVAGFYIGKAGEVVSVEEEAQIYGNQ